MAIPALTLADDWRDILRRAWSVRLILLAGLLSGLEVVLPFFPDLIPRLPYAVLTLGVVAAAFVARLIAQQGLAG
jgi:hypothetical protein